MDKKLLKQLLKKKNVVSVGIGTKKRGGVDTGIEAVVIGVRKKMPIADLKKSDIVPEMVDGKVSDVVEVGELKALSFIARVRPCPGGISCGSYRITAGTLGAWVSKGGQSVLLSNNHVLADVNQGKPGDSIVQPGIYDKGKTPQDDIAQLSTFVPIKLLNRNIWQLILDWLLRRQPVNTVDCALAKPLSDFNVINRSILGCGIPSGISEPTLGLDVKKSGRSTELTKAKVTQVDVTARVNMGIGTAIFTDQFIVESPGFSAPGDSGSVILSTENKFVGLLFAGGDSVTVGNRFSNVAKALGLD